MTLLTSGIEQQNDVSPIQNGETSELRPAFLGAKQVRKSGTIPRLPFSLLATRDQFPLPCL